MIDSLSRDHGRGSALRAPRYCAPCKREHGERVPACGYWAGVSVCARHDAEMRAEFARDRGAQ